MKSNRGYYVTCPFCGCEYVVSEIFVPNSFFGRPKDIARDYAGKILHFGGTAPAMYETYVCDKCDTEFKVRVYLMINTSVVKNSDKTTRFEEEYVTKIKGTTLTMDEQDEEESEDN